MDQLHQRLGIQIWVYTPASGKISSVLRWRTLHHSLRFGCPTHVPQWQNSPLSNAWCPLPLHFSLSCPCVFHILELCATCQLGFAIWELVICIKSWDSCCLHFCLSPLPENNFMDITIILFRDNVTKSNSEWWVLNLTGSRIFNQGSQALELVVFNDKVSPPSLGFLAGYG